jgi:hypothetical protein
VSTDDAMAQIQRAMTVVRFAEIAREESRRTVIARPEDAGRLRWTLDQAGVGDLVTVVESPYAPEGCYLVMDQQAIEAGTRETIDRMAREGRWSR